MGPRKGAMFVAPRSGVHPRGKEGSSSEPESHRVMGWGLFLKRSLASPCRSLRLQSISCTTLDNQVKFFRPQCAHLNNEGRWSTFRPPVAHCKHWMTVVNPCQGAQQSGLFLGPYLDCPTIPGLPSDMCKACWHAGKDAHSSIFEHNSVTTKRLHCDLVIYLMPPFLRDLCPCVVFNTQQMNVWMFVA